MKRADFKRHLKINGCILLREGSNHSVWVNPKNGNQTTCPKHKDAEFIK